MLTVLSVVKYSMQHRLKLTHTHISTHHRHRKPHNGGNHAESVDKGTAGIINLSVLIMAGY